MSLKIRFLSEIIYFQLWIPLIINLMICWRQNSFCLYLQNWAGAALLYFLFLKTTLFGKIWNVKQLLGSIKKVVSISSTGSLISPLPPLLQAVTNAGDSGHSVTLAHYSGHYSVHYRGHYILHRELHSVHCIMFNIHQVFEGQCTGDSVHTTGWGYIIQGLV